MIKSILLVDDDPAVLASLEGILQQCGYSVLARRDAAAALAECAAGAHIDLVITDYRMKGMDGLEFMVRLRQTLPVVPVIMVTGHATLENYLKATCLGATEYLQKPFRTRELLQIVASVLGSAADARKLVIPETEIVKGSPPADAGQC
jgi:CheY-like chemotaxis protein